MKTDKNGVSTCPIGEERWEEYPYKRLTMIQYDYRAKDGELFSGVFETLESARLACDVWLKLKLENKTRGKEK